MAVDDIPAHGRTRAYVLAFASAAVAGAGAVVGKVGVSVGTTANYLMWLFGFATLFAAAWTVIARPRMRRRFTRRGAGLLVLHATLAGVGCWGWYTGLTSLDVAVASFLGRTEVLVTIGLGIVLLGERLTRLEIAGGVLAIAGLALMTLLPGRPLGPAHAAGVAWVMLGSVGFGASEILAKQSMREMDPTTFALARSVLLALGWTAAALLTGTAKVPPWPILASAAGVALLGPVIARVLYMSAIRVLTISRAALVAQSMPLFTALVGFLALGTAPRPLEWAGGLLLVSGTLLVVRGTRAPALPIGPPE